MAFSLVDSVWPARLTLLAIGATGGLFIVPINATVQDEGQHSVGSGHAVPIQNFYQNVLMLLSVGAYTLLLANDLSVISAIAGLGVFVIAVIAILPVRRLTHPAD